jgi:hypothetical protein
MLMMLEHHVNVGKKPFPDFDDESVACNFSRNTKDVQLKTKSVHQSQGNLPDPPSDLHGIFGIPIEVIQCDILY